MTNHRIVRRYRTEGDEQADYNRLRIMVSRQHRRIWTAVTCLMFIVPLLCKFTVGRFRFTGTTVGNALQSLHTFVDPGVRHQIAQTFDETAEDDNEDDLTDPAKHFENQVRRIQRGEQIERLTILRVDRD